MILNIGKMMTYYLTKGNYSGRNNPENLLIRVIVIQTIANKGEQQQEIQLKR